MALVSILFHFIKAAHIYVGNGNSFDVWRTDTSPHEHIEDLGKIDPDLSTANSEGQVGTAFGDRDEKIIVCGGANPMRNSCFVYDSASDTKTATADMSTNRGYSAGVKLLNGSFWVTGGKIYLKVYLLVPKIHF